MSRAWPERETTAVPLSQVGHAQKGAGATRLVALE